MRGFALVFFSLLAVFPALAGNKTPAFPRDTLAIQRADGTKITFDVEIAKTPEQLEYGLMFRKNLPQGAGMLFLFPQAAQVSFWMKNTLIPLDMLFIRENGIIAHIAPQTKPLDLTLITPPEPVSGVLEIKGGEAERRGIKVGDRVVYGAFAARHHP